ncbi:ribosome small subunit-dependent GTPase A [Alkalibacter mobilis]|uniref:ribosome small subunit-dependent GTPase A n=1 Tax=Alkalibacter mobilis TaxID=2787712 RepID=UPI00189EE4D2|nr:ribosome small subunit-dependent GTPase A [Alkalibacter mobilis]MBF7095852.1 ribosome small subunit-dependent GTPase A [Alkalibacter mobilis]
MIKGRIIKGIGGFYYVETKDEIIECKARGIFRNSSEKPYVGDLVRISMTGEMTGIIEEILDRVSLIKRPPVSNATQVLVVFSWIEPKLNLQLLNKIILGAEKLMLDIVICFNKSDLTDLETEEKIRSIFKNTGYKLIFSSVEEAKGIDEIKSILQDNITILSGPSGVGKSSLIRKLTGLSNSVEVGELSEKIKRGKHTTRHVELFKIQENSYLADTPGFANFEVDQMDESELEMLFPEFEPLREQCRFKGCLHINEPDCMIKKNIGKEVSEERYEFYKQMHMELIQNRR